MAEEDKNIFIKITLKEYKELLEYKGRYLERQEHYYFNWSTLNPPPVTYYKDNTAPIPEYPYKTFCSATNPETTVTK